MIIFGLSIRKFVLTNFIILFLFYNFSFPRCLHLHPLPPFGFEIVIISWFSLGASWHWKFIQCLCVCACACVHERFGSDLKIIYLI